MRPMPTLEQQQARKYETLDTLANVRSALDALGFVTAHTISAGEDFSEHAYGLRLLLEGQTAALKEAEDRIRSVFERQDVREHNWTLDALWAAANIAGATKPKAGSADSADMTSDEVRLRADIVAQQVSAGQSPASIAKAMNLDERAVQWMVEQLEGGGDASTSAKIVNG